MKKNSNKGFTLIEIIVAVVVLAVVVVPLLSGFVTTARVNEKSRKMLNATNAAQGIMEKYADYSIKQIAEDLNPGVTFVEEADHSYTYDKPGYVYNGQTYDMRVTLNAAPYYSADPLVDGFNDQMYPEITSIDTKMDAIYAESEDVLDDALDEFVNRNMSRSTSGIRGVTRSQFEQRLSRRVILDVSYDATDNSKEVMITYEYTAPTGYVDPGEEVFAKSLYIFSDKHLAETDRKDLRNVYVLYRPYYKGIKEEIIINNPKNLEFNFYLIKLKNTLLTNAELTNAEDWYRMSLTLNEEHTGPIGAGFEASMKLLTNLGTNLGGSGTAEDVPNQITTYYCPTATYPAVTNSMITRGYFVPQYKKERIFDMTVEVYEAGNSYAADKKITELSDAQ